MHFTIRGTAAYRFNKPSFWFTWLVQKLAFSVIVAILAIAGVVSFAVTLIALAVSFTESASPDEQHSGLLSTIVFDLLCLICGFIFYKIYDVVDKKRKDVTKGKYREFYVVEDDFSYHLMFSTSLRYVEPSDELLISLFADPDMIEADLSIHRLNTERPEALRERWLKHKRILQLVQAFYVHNKFWTNDIRDELQSQHEIVDAKTNEIAHDLFGKYSSRMESLKQLIGETEARE